MHNTLRTKVQLDATDWKILISLQCDGRLSFSELSRQVGLTPPAVSERVRRLEAEGIIRGYRAEVDLARLGYVITAIIRIAVPTGGQCKTLLASLSEHPEVMEAFRVTGTESAVVKAAVSSSAHLEDLIDRITALGNSTTSIVTSSFTRVPAIEQISLLSAGSNGPYEKGT